MLEKESAQEEKTRLLRERWNSLPSSVKTMTQLIGKTAVACGATHHVMERCNFSCTCCYLGAEANKTEPLPFEEVCEQLNQLRAHLGVGGKVQITAGEVTLLPLDELGRIVAYAISLGLDPMVMTHGQRFLDEPEYLFSLVQDYGLGKVSIHVDTTQRGRRGASSKMTEVELHQVRDKFAALIREVRRRTKCPFEAASTITVTEGNLAEMSEVVDWFIENADAFRLLSFQPVADVGRTRKERSKNAVDTGTLWDQVEMACGRPINTTPMHFGHPSCNTTVPMIVVGTGERRVIFEGIRRDHHEDELMFSRAVDKIGPALDWTAPAIRNVFSIAWIFLKEPRFLIQSLVYGCRRLIGELGRIGQVLWNVVREFRFPRVKPFLIVVHNFMSPGELDTEEGKERLDACVFKLPVDGEMVSMCEMNATDMRAKIDRMQIAAREAAELKQSKEGASV